MKILTVLCIIAITGLAVIVFVQVLSRLFKYSLPGTEELSRLLIVWLTFLGSSLAVYEKMHLGVRYFVGLANEKNQKRIDFMIHLVTIGFFSLLTIYGFKLVMSTMATTSATLHLPMAVFYVVIPISSVLSVYFIIMDMLNPSRKMKEEVSL